MVHNSNLHTLVDDGNSSVLPIFHWAKPKAPSFEERFGLTKIIENQKLSSDRQGTKYQSYYETTRLFLQNADQQKNPADITESLKLARSILILAGDKFPHRKNLDVINKIILYEARSCAEAAKMAQSIQKKLQWLFRGIEVLNIKRDSDSLPAGLNIDNRERGLVAASLWKDLGDIFSSQDPDMTDSSLVAPLLKYKPLIIEGSLIEAAAIAYELAGHFLQSEIDDFLDRPSNSATLYFMAYQVYKKIPIYLYVADVQNSARLQGEIVSLCLKIPTTLVDRETIYFEAISAAMANLDATHKSSGASAIHFAIMSVSHFETALDFSSGLTDTLKFYEMVVYPLKMAWENNPEECLKDRLFLNANGWRRDFENTLLARLERKKQLIEMKLKEELPSQRS